MATGHGRADYLLYVDQRVVGVIEAKPEGTPLSGVEWQSAMYAEGLPSDVRLAAQTKDGRLPFVFESSGTETHFTNGFDPEPRARQIFNFPKAATLAKTLRGKDEEHPTWRGKVTAMPPLDATPLRPAQIEAINRVEQSLGEQRYNRSLVQMATGAGKTCSEAGAPYIDLATEILRDGDDLIYGGRVVFSFDGTGCLFCLGVIDQAELAREQMDDAQRADRDRLYGLTAEQSGGSGPSVVTINGVVASLACTEALMFLTGLREPARPLTCLGQDSVVRKSTTIGDPNCLCCSRWREAWSNQ